MFWRRNGLLILALAAIIASEHAQHFVFGVTPKLYPFAQAFEALERGQLWLDGTLLSISNIRIGGPLYYWLHYPLAWLRLPYWSLHLMYLALELGALLLWLALGRRHFSQRTVRWGGLFLAVSPYCKQEIGESGLFLVVLPLLIYLALLRALDSGRLRAFVAPALLWGVALQLHISALFVAPAVILAVWAAGDRRWARLGLMGGLFLVAGVAPTFAGALLRGADLSSLSALSDIVRGERDSGVIFSTLGRLAAANAVAIWGLVLLARRRPWTPRALLTGLWFCLPVVVTFALDPDEFKTWHYVMVLPAYMVLSAHGAAALAGWLAARRRPAAPRLRRRLRLELLAAACLAVSLYQLQELYLKASEDSIVQELTENEELDALGCEAVIWAQFPVHHHRMLEAVKRQFSPAPGRRVRFSGLSHDHLAGGLWFETRGAQLDFWSRSNVSSDLEVAVAFPLPEVERLPPGRRLLGSEIYTMFQPISVQRPDVRRRRQAADTAPFSAPDGAVHALVHLEGDLGFEVESLLLHAGGRALAPASQLVCSRWGRYVGQFVFDLRQAGGRPGPMTLGLRHRAGVVNYLAEVVFF